MDGRCMDCRFRGNLENEWDGYADCRRYPPFDLKSDARGGHRAVWMRTGRHDWCGEFQPKEQDQ